MSSEESPTAPADVDLAVMDNQEIRHLAKSHRLEHSGLSRTQIVKLLRDNGIGSSTNSAGQSDKVRDVVQQTLADIAKNVKELAAKVALISALQLEVSSLRGELAALKERNSDHDPVQTSTPEPQPVRVQPPADSVRLYSAAARAQSSQVRARDNTWGGPRPSQQASTTRPQTSHPGPSTQVTSYYENRPKRSDQLQGGSRTKCCALYVGNVNSGCTSESIAKWCERRNIPVIKCSVSETKYFGLAFAHVILPIQHKATVLEPEFWPSNVRVREWRFKADSVATGRAAEEH